MVELVIRIKDRSKAKELASFGPIIHVSKYLNLVTIEAPESAIPYIKRDPNVMRIRIAEVGAYQI